MTLLAQVQETQRNIERIAAAGAGTSEEARLRGLAFASERFTTQVRQALAGSEFPATAIRTLAEQHRDLIADAARSHRRAALSGAVEAQAQMDWEIQRLIRETLFVVTGCLLIGSLLAFVTLLLAGRLIHNKERQGGRSSTASPGSCSRTARPPPGGSPTSCTTSSASP